MLYSYYYSNLRKPLIMGFTIRARDDLSGSHILSKGYNPPSKLKRSAKFISNYIAHILSKLFIGLLYDFRSTLRNPSIYGKEKKTIGHPCYK